MATLATADDASEIDWQDLVDSVLLEAVVAFAEGSGRVEAVYLTGSYLRGQWNPRRPNVNVYFIARAGDAPTVRMELGRLFHELRGQLRAAGVDLMIDCHPYTISQQDFDWAERPLLTLTTKVLEGEDRDRRYRIAPSIGLGWHKAHRVVFGRSDALDVFARPPTRDRAWFSGVHEALSHYRNVLDHLPWALDWVDAPRRLLEESCRYAEEALRDGVHIGLTEDELAAGENIRILHDWRNVGREFFRERYGEDGPIACDTVARLKAQVGDARSCDTTEAERAWFDAIGVWSVIWNGYLHLAREARVEPELMRVTAWL